MAPPYSLTLWTASTLCSHAIQPYFMDSKYTLWPRHTALLYGQQVHSMAPPYSLTLWTASTLCGHAEGEVCCFTSTETVGLLWTGAQDVHLDFHTAPELRGHATQSCFINSKGRKLHLPATSPVARLLSSSLSVDKVAARRRLTDRCALATNTPPETSRRMSIYVSVLFPKTTTWVLCSSKRELEHKLCQ